MDDGLDKIFRRGEGAVHLGTKIIGRKIYAYDTVTSTNDLAHELAREGEPEGSVIFAAGQTQGRGRLGRSWASPYGEGLYCSCILRPALSLAETPRLTLTAAVAVAGALNEAGADGLSIKWPNDILLRGKKVCGILTEMSGADATAAGLQSEASSAYVIVGIGINVNAPAEHLPAGATSLRACFLRDFDIPDLSHMLMRKLDAYYGVLLARGFEEILREVKERSALALGERVRIFCEGTVAEGYVVDFDAQGGLVLRQDNGFLRKVYSGTLSDEGK